MKRSRSRVPLGARVSRRASGGAKRASMALSPEPFSRTPLSLRAMRVWRRALPVALFRIGLVGGKCAVEGGVRERRLFDAVQGRPRAHIHPGAPCIGHLGNEADIGQGGCVAVTEASRIA